MDVASRWNVLGNLFGAPNAVNPQKENLVQADKKLSLLQKIQKAPSKRWGPTNPPNYVYHVTTRDSWMKNAEVYSAPLKKIECCDEDRIHAYVTRNHFPKEFSRKMHELNEANESYISRFLNSLDLGNFHAKPRAAYNDAHRTDVVEEDSLVLLVIDATFYDEIALFHWHTDKFAYPYIEGPIDRYKGVADFRVRYDSTNNTLCLPSRVEVMRRMHSALMIDVARD